VHQKLTLGGRRRKGKGQGERKGKELDGLECSPLTKHIDQMLLRNVVLLVHIPLQRRKDLPPLQQPLPCHHLQLPQTLVRDPIHVRPRLASPRRDHKVLELLAEDDDALLVEERVRRRVVVEGRGGGGEGIGRGVVEGGLELVEAWLVGGTVEVESGFLEEVQDIVEAVWRELGDGREAERGGAEKEEEGDAST
jgi:hypothetical protein